MLKQDDLIIFQSKERCRLLELDPTVLPTFSKCLSSEALEQRVTDYEEVLDVINFFIKKFLSTVEGTPFLVIITDDEGYVLRLGGDSSIVDNVNQLGIKEGVRFVEEDAGVNSISLSLRYDQPIQLIGEDHYHEILHRAACYSVPIRNRGNKQLLGTITLLTFIPYNNSLFLAMLNTIVDSIERELQIREKNKQLNILNQVLLQTSHQTVFVTNVQGNIIDCNERGRHFLKEVSTEKSDYECFNIVHVEPLGSYFKHVILTQKENIGVELSISLEDVAHYFILDVVPIFDEKGSFICIVGSLRDITEMKNAEDLLRNAEKLSIVGQLAAGVAHEIRNPLTTVRGLLQFSKDSFQPDHYDLLLSEIDRMNFIVSEFLVIGKPHAVQFKDVDCLSILNDILKIVETQAIMNDISISAEVRSYGMIHCDPNQIKQVFINILKNSMEAMPYGGHIQVVVDTRGSEQLVRFSDNGEGMDEDVLRKIGQPFCSTKKYGNGLGIMVTKKIIDSHKGKISFTSQVSVGTTVEICLPLNVF